VRHAFPYGDNSFPYGEYHIASAIPMAEIISIWRILPAVVENVWRKLID